MICKTFLLRGPNIIAESFIDDCDFDTRVQNQFRSHKSVILFWDFEDIHSISAYFQLTSPLEILCFDFNPSDPNIVVGIQSGIRKLIFAQAGAFNGQVLLWDLRGTDFMKTHAKKTVTTKGKEQDSNQTYFPLCSKGFRSPARKLAWTSIYFCSSGSFESDSAINVIFNSN